MENDVIIRYVILSRCFIYGYCVIFVMFIVKDVFNVFYFF